MKQYVVKNSRFSIGTFCITLGIFWLLSGLHMGLILLVNQMVRNGALRTIIVMLYWIFISISVTLYIKYQMKNTYEKPLKQIAEATSKVAHGDFSVYIPPLHTKEKLDYLDVMIMDFNKMVEELGSIETLKTDFFSNVSHEIKTPIAVIQNSAEFIKCHKITEAEQDEYMDSIIQSSKKLSTLIGNILKLNKLEKQNILPIFDSYDLSEQLCQCALQFENIWEKKGITFEVDIVEGELICADESLLELVWTNLLSNAFKFTEVGGFVGLKAYATDASIIISVSDTGIGMNEETMRFIFDKFYQGDTSHSSEGNGLGLSLALRIVHMLEGNITVESQLSEGTTFRVILPKIK